MYLDWVEVSHMCERSADNKYSSSSIIFNCDDIFENLIASD